MPAVGHMDEKSFKISKQMTRLLRHQGHPLGKDVAIEWRRLLPSFCRGHPDAPKWTNQIWTDCLQRGRDKKRFQCCLDSIGYLLYMRAIQGHSGGNKVDPSPQDDVEIPYTSFEYICHVGSSHECHSIIQSSLIAGGKDTKERGQSVFFTVVDAIPLEAMRGSTHYTAPRASHTRKTFSRVWVMELNWH